jgi:RHS repeat-associated protein
LPFVWTRRRSYCFTTSGPTTIEAFPCTDASTSTSGASIAIEPASSIEAAEQYRTLGAEFSCNGDGLGTSKTVGGDTTEYVLDLMATLPVVVSDTEAVYLYGLDIIAQQQAERLYYVHDGLGSVRQLVDTTGEIETNYAYDPFGVPLVGGEVYNPYQYTGEAWDAEVELLYLRARYYQPEVGRFITKDPWEGVETGHLEPVRVRDEQPDQQDRPWWAAMRGAWLPTANCVAQSRAGTASTADRHSRASGQADTTAGTITSSGARPVCCTKILRDAPATDYAATRAPYLLRAVEGAVPVGSLLAAVVG